MLSHGTASIAAIIALHTLQSISAPPIASSGCGKSAPVGLLPGGASFNFTVHSEEGAGQRKYLLHLPLSYTDNEPAPVIIALHAFGQTTSSMEEITRFSGADTNKRYVAVYPEGINNLWLGDPGAPNSSVIDDRPFIQDLLDTVETTLCIDRSRIYTTGFSNGGGLSGLLACYPPTAGRIAAFSGISAAYYTKESLGYSLFEMEACNTGAREGPVPFLDVHGDSDGVIAYDGDNSKFDIDQDGVPDPDTLPILQWLNDWATRNGCSAAANNTLENYLVTGDVAKSSSWIKNVSIERSVWNCGGWAEAVTGYYVRGLGHGWPSTVPLDGILEEYRGGVTSWNASALLMEWFSRWSLPA